MPTTTNTTGAHVLLVQHIRATNDHYGNPRRCFVLYEVGHVNDNPDHGSYTRVVSVEDEGYSGEPQDWKRLPHLPSVDVAPAEYRRFLAM